MPMLSPQFTRRHSAAPRRRHGSTRSARSSLIVRGDLGGGVDVGLARFPRVLGLRYCFGLVAIQRPNSGAALMSRHFSTKFFIFPPSRKC
jgi:hypothetical protein